MNQDTNIGEYLYFSVYVDGVLTYTKYNFDFQTYKSDNSLTSNDKGEVFKHFLNLNGIDWTQPTVVKNELKKYFTPITNDIKNYFNKYGWIFHDNYTQRKKPLGSVSFNDICTEQFRLKDYTDQQFRKVQDYFFTDDSNNYYTKYNFNFSQYQSDFKVVGTKLEVFTNFVIRCLKLSGTEINSSGYGLYEPFTIYFNIDNNTIIDYTKNYGIHSDYENVRRNVNNIDFSGYINANGDLKDLGYTIPQAKEHYASFGQFERRIIPLYVVTPTNRDMILQSVCSIYRSEDSGLIKIGTGFLYNNTDGTNKIYLITCYHINENTYNNNTIFASFELVDPSSDSEIVTTTALFRIIGYDIYSDILVGLYDETLQYNVINSVNMTPFQRIAVNFNYTLKSGITLVSVGNLGFENNKSYVEGTVVDPIYTGNFYEYSLPIPDSILIELNGTKGFSGAPLFAIAEDKSLICVGMINGTFINYDQYTIGITGFTFNIIVNKIIETWNNYSQTFINDIVNLNYFLKNIVTKRWLGIVGSYFNNILTTSNFNSTKNFPLNGGIVVSEFILGYNFVNNSFVTDILELSNQEIFRINTPLLNTTMYRRFVDNNKEPIIITSITFYDGIKSDFKKSYLGKFSSQESYSKLMYGLSPIGSKPISGYTNETRSLYPNIIIDYYYYNGKDWIPESITVGGNSSDKYNEYTDPLGYKYYQHQFEIPITLIPYLKPYVFETTSRYGNSNKNNSMVSTNSYVNRNTNRSLTSISGTINRNTNRSFVSLGGPTINRSINTSLWSG